jgi:hypothetical protein
MMEETGALLPVQDGQRMDEVEQLAFFEGTRMMFKSLPGVGAEIIIPAGLDDLRAIGENLRFTFFAGPDDGDMAGHLWVEIFESYNDQFALVGEVLGNNGRSNGAPALVCALAKKPFLLGIGEKHGGVFRRMEQIDAELIRGGGGESAAMRVRLVFFVVFAHGRSGAPIHLAACKPELVHVQGIKRFSEMFAGGGDFVRMNLQRGQNEKQRRDGEKSVFHEIRDNQFCLLLIQKANQTGCNLTAFCAAGNSDFVLGPVNPRVRVLKFG